VARAREKGGPWVALAAAVFYPMTLLLAKRRMEGLEKVPERGPAMLVCNHISYLDPVYTAVFGSPDADAGTGTGTDAGADVGAGTGANAGTDTASVTTETFSIAAMDACRRGDIPDARRATTTPDVEKCVPQPGIADGAQRVHVHHCSIVPPDGF